MLVKQGLTGNQNGCLVTRGDLEAIRWPLAALADTVSGMAGDVLESDPVQKIRALSDVGTCLRPHPQWALDSVWEA